MPQDRGSDEAVFSKFEELRSRVKDLENKLEQREERIKAQTSSTQTLWSLVEELDEGVLEFQRGLCVRFNAAAARMLGAGTGVDIRGVARNIVLQFEGETPKETVATTVTARRRIKTRKGVGATVCAHRIFLGQTATDTEFWLLENEEPLEELRRACDLWAARYRGVTSALFEGMCIFKDGRILEVNPALCAMFGYSAEEAVGSDPFQYFPEDVHEDLRAKALAESLRPYIVQARKKDGTLFYVEVSGRRTPFMHADWSFVLIRDVNETVMARRRLQETMDNLEAEVRRRTDELTHTNENLTKEIERHHEATRHLRQEQNLVRALLDSAPFAISFKDTQGRYVRINAAQAHWLGIDEPHEALGRTDADFLPPPAAARIRKNEELILQTGDAKIDAIERGRQNGKETVWLATTVLPWSDSHGKIVGTISISRDVSAVKSAEDALRASEERFRSLAENSRDTIMRFDRECRHLYTNAVVEESTGIPAAQFIGKTHAEMGFPPDLVHLWENAIQTTFQTKESQRIEFQLPTGVWIDWLLMPETDPNGHVHTVLASARNITESRQSLTRMAESETFLRALIENIPDFIGVLDESDRYIYVNRVTPGARNDEVIGKPVGVYLDAKDKAVMRDALEKSKNGIAAEIDVKARTSHGTTSWHSHFIPIVQDGQKRILIISNNVTAEREARAELEESESRFRSIVENSPDHIVIADRDRRVLFVNHADHGELMAPFDGMTADQFIHDADRDVAVKAFLDTLETGIGREIEIRGLMRDGSWGWYLARLAPMRRDGEISGVVIVVTDIRDKKSRENAARMSEETTRSLLNASPLAAMLIDRDAVVLAYNELLAELAGWEVAPSSPISLLDWLEPESVERRRRVAKDVFLTGETKTYRDTFRERLLDVTVSPVFDSNGSVLRFAVFIDDITEKEKVEGEQRTFKRAVEQSLHGIAVLDLQDNVVFANSAWDRMHGRQHRETVGKRLDAFHSASQWVSEVQPFLAVVRDTGAHSSELGRIRADGTYFPSLTTMSNVLDDSGVAVAKVLIAQDDAERRQTLQDLRDALAKAREADLLKGRFLANMSHELRTPLNAVIGLVEVLELEPEMDLDKRLHYTTLIRRAAQSLLLIVNNLLKLSKIEAGKYTLEPTAFPLRSLVEDICRRYEPQAHAKMLALNFEFGEGIPNDLVGDPVMLELVLNNLIGNAIKFTAQGRIGLTVTRTSISGRNLRARFEIRDTGIGIAEEHLPHIFDAFYQADDSTTRAYQGTGLGLAITREFVELMGGSITVKSELNNGSCFSFEIDLEVPTTAA